MFMTIAVCPIFYLCTLVALIADNMEPNCSLKSNLIRVHSVCFSDKVTVIPALSGHSKIDKTKILKTNGSLMKIESIAECSPCNTMPNLFEN